MRIGLIRHGGYGDAIAATGSILGVREKYPDAVITAYVGLTVSAILNGFPALSRVQQIDIMPQPGRLFEDLAREKFWSDCDIWFDLKPVPMVYYRDQSLESEKVKHWRSSLERLHLGYIDSCRELSAFCLSQGKLISEALDIPYFCPELPRYRRTAPHSYVTLCNEAWGQAPTKTWFSGRWSEVVDHCARLGLKVCQIGEHPDSSIQGTENLTGKLTLHNAMELVAGSAFHLGIEGIWGHFCSSVGVPGIIIFGPTPAGFFGYDSNINIQSSVCGDCWWQTSDWMLKCPKGFSYEDRLCMRSVTSEMVIGAIKSINH